MLTRDEARAYFAACGLNYKDITLHELRYLPRLHGLLPETLPSFENDDGRWQGANLYPAAKRLWQEWLLRQDAPERNAPLALEDAGALPRMVWLEVRGSPGKAQPSILMDTDRPIYEAALSGAPQSVPVTQAQAAKKKKSRVISSGIKV